MHISSTHPSHGLARKSGGTIQDTKPELSAEQDSVPEDLYDFKTNATTAAGLGLFGGALGAVPVVGIFTNGHSNGAGASTFTKATAAAASLSNLVVSGLVLTGNAPTWTLAIPGALGAASWAGYAVDTRNHV